MFNRYQFRILYFIDENIINMIKELKRAMETAQISTKDKFIK